MTIFRAPPPLVAVPLPEILVIAREYVDAGRYDAAERVLGHVLGSMPQQAEALHLKGFIAFKRGQIAEAAELMEAGIAAGGASSSQLCNLGEVYRMLCRLDDGLAIVRRAAAIAPIDATCHFNESMLRYERMEIDACISASRRAIQLRPHMPEAHMRLGQALLLNGEFAEGWEEYEWRYQIAGATPLLPQNTPRFGKPQWDGRVLESERLLLIADQGYGDVVMFCRYIPWALERCMDAVLACSPELIPTLQRMFPALPIFSRWEDCPEHAVYCPLSGLPRLHGTRVDNIPAAARYLAPDPARAEAWKRRLDVAIPAGLKRIGLVWAGRPTHNNDRHRSVRLDTLHPFGDVPGTALVSLQKGPAASQAEKWPGPARLLNLDAEIRDFEDTIAIIDALDLVVAVDTSVAHFTGALSRPAWVMLPFAPDFRWLTGRADSPWYPSLRLHRQRAPMAWAPLVEEVAEALRMFAPA